MGQRVKILWLDDEPHFMREHIGEIEHDGRFDLKCCRKVSEAIAYLDDLRKNGERLQLLIWDMILPPDPFSLEETARGLRTGQVFVKKYFWKGEYGNVPKVLFTNVSDAEVIHMYNTGSRGRSWVWQKRDVAFDEVVGRIAEILELPPPSQDPA